VSEEVKIHHSTVGSRPLSLLLLFTTIIVACFVVFERPMPVLFLLCASFIGLFSSFAVWQTTNKAGGHFLRRVLGGSLFILSACGIVAIVLGVGLNSIAILVGSSTAVLSALWMLFGRGLTASDMGGSSVGDMRRDLSQAREEASDAYANAVRWQRAYNELEQEIASGGMKKVSESRENKNEGDDDQKAQANDLVGGKLVSGSLARRFQITYKDLKGKVSDKEIAVYAVVERSGVVNLDTFSKSQISCRTYRADRIQKLTDLQSGDVVEENIVDWIVETSS
jgi:hypothetical protein